jgi:hypothetical protein
MHVGKVLAETPDKGAQPLPLPVCLRYGYSPLGRESLPYEPPGVAADEH